MDIAKTPRRVLVSSCLIVLVVLNGGCATQHDSESAVESSSSSGATITNLHKVNADLYRSGHLGSAAHVESLAHMGIHTILSLEDYGTESYTADDERGWAQDAGMKFIWESMDPHQKPSMNEVDRALSVINNSANWPILVHCKAGSDRTGLVLAAYRITHDHWSVDDAKAEMYQLGHSPGLSSWDSLLNQLP